MRKAIVILFLPLALVMQVFFPVVLLIVFMGYWFHQQDAGFTREEFFTPMIMWMNAFENAARNDRQ